MKWTLSDRGFLPYPDPLTRLREACFAHVEELAQRLPEFVHEQRFREVAVQELRTPIEWEPISAEDAEPSAERLFMLFSYFGSAYVHAPGSPPVQRLPGEIAVPLVRLGQRCGRPPILSYASYCLHNWRRIAADGPIELGNIQLLQNFSLPGNGKTDEDWFILVHVDIEARAGRALIALQSLPSVLADQDDSLLEKRLEEIGASLRDMNRTLARMPEGCSPDVYFLKVRPYIFGFNEIVYDGCFDNRAQTYRGETGAQSSIIPILLMAFGIRHKSSLLTQHLDDMRNYMPLPQREFIKRQVSVRERVMKLTGQGGAVGLRLKDLYNDCMTEIIAFRSRHFEYAVSYIQKKVDNPLATGGTPYIPWLRQLIEETQEHFL